MLSNRRLIADAYMGLKTVVIFCPGAMLIFRKEVLVELVIRREIVQRAACVELVELGRVWASTITCSSTASLPCTEQNAARLRNNWRPSLRG